MWACLKELIEHKEIELEDDADTVAQLSTRKYRIASNGKIEIEGKDEMKKTRIKITRQRRCRRIIGISWKDKEIHRQYAKYQ